jgi:serine/threonine protein kinase
MKYTFSTAVSATSSFRILIADFDLAHDFLDEDSKTDNFRGGTLVYHSPEAAAGKAKGRASDVFSLGCVLAEMHSVIWGESLDDFKSYRASDGNSAYHLNLEKVHQWLRKTMSYYMLKLPSVGILPYRPMERVDKMIEMLDPNPSQRPTAQALIDSKAFGNWSTPHGLDDCLCQKLPLIRED